MRYNLYEEEEPKRKVLQREEVIPSRNNSPDALRNPLKFGAFGYEWEFSKQDVIFFLLSPASLVLIHEFGHLAVLLLLGAPFQLVITETLVPSVLWLNPEPRLAYLFLLGPALLHILVATAVFSKHNRHPSQVLFTFGMGNLAMAFLTIVAEGALI